METPKALSHAAETGPSPFPVELPKSTGNSREPQGTPLKRRRHWRFKHYGKRVYPSRYRARLAILRIWLRERRLDSLQPYTCQHTAIAADGPTGQPHIHIGHGRYTPQARVRRRLRRMFLYPFFRARRRVRACLRSRA